MLTWYLLENMKSEIMYIRKNRINMRSVFLFLYLAGLQMSCFPITVLVLCFFFIVFSLTVFMVIILIFIGGLLRLSVQFSRSIVSNSVWPHGLQHAKLPCPSTTPRVYSNSCPLIRWWHPTISSSVNPFSSHLQSLSALESFQMSQLFASSGQSIGVSDSASVLPMKIQDWFPLGWTGLML